MRIGICVGIDQLADAHEAGYAYAEMAVGTLLTEQDEAAFAPVRKQILDAPIRVEAFNCFLPASIRVTGPSVDLDAVKKHMETALRRASEVGAEIMVFGSGGARTLPDGFPLNRGWYQLEEAARIAADTAAKYQMTIVMEPLLKRACNFFHRVDEGAAFVDRVNHPNLSLLTDLYHITAEEEPFTNIADAGARFAHTHLATPAIPATGEGVNYDFKTFFAELAKAGYDGRTSVEDNPGLFAGKSAPFTAMFRAVLEYVQSNLPVKA
ncbi:MAG: sugar phosphate isomerase/epimerase family protein [Armatimonadota bacterium]